MSRLSLAAVLVCLSLSACDLLLVEPISSDGGTTSGTGGGAGTGGSGGTTALTVDAYCSSLIDLFANVMSCALPSKEAALSLYNRTDPCGDMKRAVTSGVTAFDATAAQACLNGLRAMTCETGYLSLPECALVLKGTVPVGGTCHIGPECVPGSYCPTSAGSQVTCPGKCVAYAKLGEACGASPGATCEAGLECSANTARCVKVPGLGEPCSTSCASGLGCGADKKCAARQTSGPCPTRNECAVHFSCVGSGAAATCQPAGKLGESCSAMTAPCDVKLRCEGSTGRCEAYRENGAACTPSSFGAFSSACANGYCDGVTKLCTAYKAVGATCTAGQYECGYMAECGATGVCPVAAACHVP